MTVQATPLPAASALHAFVAEGDFLDCYAVPSEKTPREAAEIALTFPGWVDALMKLRNAIVAPFGLATEPPEGETIGFFPLDQESEHELIAGFNDKHLNFRLSVLAHEGRIHMATWVHPNNFGGRLYLTGVMPFHIVIVKNALKRVRDAG